MWTDNHVKKITLDINFLVIVAFLNEAWMSTSLTHVMYNGARDSMQLMEIYSIFHYNPDTHYGFSFWKQG